MNDDEIVDAIRSLVDVGAYRDELPMRPGLHLDGGGAFKKGPDGVLQRLIERGSPEHETALKAGEMDRLPRLVPARKKRVDEAQRIIGQPLPGLLRALYLEVANGGFGPGYG